MKSKAPLFLMEQLIMLLVFALAAALCLQVFSLSARISRRNEARSHAAAAVQNTAEAVKACGGDISKYPHFLGGMADGKQWLICYDKDWAETTAADASYRIVVARADTSLPTLGQASITAQTNAGDPLFSLTVSWQEVAYE